MKLSPFTEHIIQTIQEKINMPVIFRHITPEFGGSINEAFKVETSAGYFFVKRNDKNLYPGMFEKEARGLALMAQTGAIHIPPFVAHGTYDGWQFLIMHFVEKGMPKKDFWEDFGRGIAQLHQLQNEKFGLDYDNFIGSLPQENKWNTSWGDFFVQHRLEPMLAHALHQKKLNHLHYDLFHKLYPKLNNFFPNEKPVLLHGDFWNGNFMADQNGHPMIFDPAVYYGHREMDLAMSLLFGGFHEKFYAAYREVFPMEDGWRDRARVANLYPLLVHVNLFGGGYINEIDSILQHYK